MDVSETPGGDPGREKDHPDYGERPESPDEGHPGGETQPVGGIDENVNEHPEDITPPGGSERDEGPTSSPAEPPASDD